MIRDFFMAIFVGTSALPFTNKTGLFVPIFVFGRLSLSLSLPKTKDFHFYPYREDCLSL